MHRYIMGAYCCIPPYIFQHPLPSRAFHTWPEFTVVILKRSYLPKSLLKCQFAGNNACKSIIKPPPSGNYVKQMKRVKFSQRWKFLSGCQAELQMISTRCNFLPTFRSQSCFSWDALFLYVIDDQFSLSTLSVCESHLSCETDFPLIVLIFLTWLKFTVESSVIPGVNFFFFF